MAHITASETSPTARGGIKDETLRYLLNPSHTEEQETHVSPERNFDVEATEVKSPRSFEFGLNSHQADAPRDFALSEMARTSPKMEVVVSPTVQPAVPTVSPKNTTSASPTARRPSKYELLAKLNRLRSRGFSVRSDLSAETPEETIYAEWDKIKEEVALNQSVRMYRRFLVAFVTFSEWGNNRFDPIGLELDGWTENTMINIDDYDSIFERMYESHKGKFKMSPMTELMFTMVGSAFMFHMTKSRFKTGEISDPTSVPTVAPAPVPKSGGSDSGGMPFVGNLMSNMARAMNIPSMPQQAPPMGAQPSQAPSAPMPPHAVPQGAPMESIPEVTLPEAVPPNMQMPPEMINMASGMLNNPQLMSMMGNMLGSMGGMGGMGQ